MFGFYGSVNAASEMLRRMSEDTERKLRDDRMRDYYRRAVAELNSFIPKETTVKTYSHERYASLLSQTFENMRALGNLKGGEYSGDNDRLANFRRNGANLGLSMETVWAVYAGKHWDAIMQWIKDEQAGKERVRLEPIAGRVDDLLVYLILFKAMLDERGLASKPAL